MPQPRIGRGGDAGRGNCARLSRVIRNQARFILIGAIVALIALGVLTIPTQGDAQSEPSGVEVRLAGRLHEDGRIEVALQYWWNG